MSKPYLVTNSFGSREKMESHQKSQRGNWICDFHEGQSRFQLYRDAFFSKRDKLGVILFFLESDKIKSRGPHKGK